MTHHFFQSVDKRIEADVVVVGAGLVGLSAAIALAKQGKSVVLVDAKPEMNQKTQTWDERIYALSPESETWLKSLDVWPYIEAERVCAIDGMHIWHDSEELVLSSSDANLPKLGVIIENQNLMRALWQQIKALDVTIITDANCAFLENTEQHISLHLENKNKISAKLIVAADGVKSWVRSQVKIDVKLKEFHQAAIVANFLAEKNHENIARQWFAPHETLALLPLPDKHVSMVWSVSTERASELLRLSSVGLVEKVEALAKPELGVLSALGKALSFSLNQQTATSLIAGRVVLVGDAAHQVHPMAGQGVNLGFRDVMALEGILAGVHAMQDIGEKSFLRKYERSRQADIATMNSLISSLDYLFASRSRLIKNVTNWGLRQLNQQTTIKKLLIQQAVI